jgi:hypothetical protein
MAAGRPVLFIGPRQATPARLVRRFQCGWHVEAGNGAGVIRLLEQLWSDRSSVWIHGLRARQAFETHYDLPHGIARICAALGVGVAAPVAHALAVPVPAEPVPAHLAAGQ